MFGQDDQQDNQTAAAPEPVADTTLDDTTTVNDNPFVSNPAAPPAGTFDSTPTTTSPPTTSDSDDLLGDGANDDLLAIKQDALQQLSPLVNHLDQSPEEKFKTTMMMIQASDDQSLVRDAYETAKQITDEKARAQALLDIVNEINYFTQHQNNE